MQDALDTYVGALIDGFTISGGNANGTNEADKNGGGIYNLYSNPTLTNCICRGNVSADSGGAMYNPYMWNAVTLTNCIFSNNVAGKGGGIYLNSGARMSNCTFSGNSANLGGGMYNDDESYVILTDCILWANSDSGGMDETAQIHGLTQIVKYSCIQDTNPNDATAYSGTGNIDDNPLFVSGNLGDYYLSHTDTGQDKNSPCVDAGSNSAANVGMNRLTTCTDEATDKGILDMGYHYSIPKHADLDGYVAPASYPTPIDNLTDVRLEPVLVWSAGYGALYHNVYLGTDANTVANADNSSSGFMGTISNRTFSPNTLAYDTTYYWRIDEVGAACTAEGDTWSFTTGGAVAKIPSPADGAEAVLTDVVLSWSPGAGAISHDIYLGADANAVTSAVVGSNEYKGNYAVARYDPYGLEHNATYYWRIDEVDGFYTHKGELWSFTTGLDLVGCWKFDESSGTTAYDSAGDNHGTVYGAQWTTGRISGALSFDGVDDYVAMPGFNLTTNTATFVAWINGWKAGNWAGIVYSRTRNRDSCGMDFGSNNTLHYTWNDNSEETWGWEGGPQIPQNQWAMVALVIEPNKATAYVYTEAGGLQQGVNNIPHVSQTVENLKVGWDEHRDSRRFEGVIDDVRIYNSALSAEEIEQLTRIEQ